MNSYNTLDEVRNYLIPLGFKEYKPTPFDNQGICTNFQKRYDDEFGKKFFIDAKIWDYSWSNRVPENYHIEYHTQLYENGTHDAIDIEFLDWDIYQVERWVNKLFENGMIEHYEKF